VELMATCFLNVPRDIRERRVRGTRFDRQISASGVIRPSDRPGLGWPVLSAHSRSMLAAGNCMNFCKMPLAGIAFSSVLVAQQPSDKAVFDIVSIKPLTQLSQAIWLNRRRTDFEGGISACSN
jgi:hypothetical protein